MKSSKRAGEAYQTFFNNLPEEEKVAFKDVEFREGIQLNIQLDAEQEVHGLQESYTKMVEKIIAQNTVIPVPFLPIVWLQEPILIERYKKLINVITKNPDWYKENAGKIDIGDDAIYFPEMGLVIELSDAGLSEWEKTSETFSSLSIDNLTKIGEWIETLPEASQKDMREFLGFQDTAPYWSSDEFPEDNQYAWYYNFADHLYGNVAKKTTFHHTRFTK